MFENYSIGDVLGIFGRCCIFLLCCDLVWFGALCFFYLGLKWCFVAFVWLLAAVSSFFSAFQQKICEDSLTFFGDFGNFKQILIQRGATMQIFYNLFSQLQKYFDGKGQELSWIIWVWSKVYLERLFVVFLAIGRMNIVQQNQIVLDRSQENELLLQNRSWMSFSLEVLWRNSFIQWEHFAMRGNKC